MPRNNKLEQDLVNMFIDIMKRKAKQDGKAISFTQIETGSTAIGVPDLMMFYDNQMYWIEAKRIKLRAESCCGNNVLFTGTIQFRPGQVRFLHKLLFNGEKPFVLVLSEGCDCCVIPINDIPLDCESTYKVHHKGVDYTQTYDYIKGLLK